MTREEQIKQNAEQYAKNSPNRDAECVIEKRYAYIAGAHSRDEEIEELKERMKYADESIADADKWIAKYKLESDQLRNPWISVKERLPEKVNKFLSDEVLVRYLRGGKEYTFVTHYDYEYQTWNIPNVTHWMPIPELKKGE